MSTPVQDFPPEAEDSCRDSDSASDSLSIANNDEGWEDVEPEEESQPVVGLFTADVYPDVRAMLKDTKERYNFDFVKVQRDLDLDFLGSVRLVNYLRSEIKKGNKEPSVSSTALFQDDIYLKPVLDDDTLLYSLDDLTDEVEVEDPDKSNEKRILELQEELERLKTQFSEYRLAVQKSIGEQLAGTSVNDNPAGSEIPKRGRIEEADADYFTSYSFNTIHETMLKDTVRTDAYRDFIYDNKGLFKDKVVLDVGCGTGILSMFCAKAGAKMVIAVDNSNIIQKARENIYKNGFEHVIRCVRGKIEEVSLPVPQVDIIVSEWMGYGLLFEAMLDSVLWARDHYLVPGGLMVPSHTTLRIAPYVDSDFVDSHVTFWKSVYGFDMSSMLENIHDEAIVTTTKPETVVGSSAVFLPLPLHTITVEELSFVKSFEVTLKEDIPGLDGWNIWFDTFFLPSPTFKFDENVEPSEIKKKGLIAFTTGPFGTETHWQQCVLLANHSGKEPTLLKKGQTIKGSVGYQKKEKGSRALDIEVLWDIDGNQQRQLWSLQ
ncbi:protein arginine methyltransferase RmtB [Talaromyces stipitatus ATCC 10500]|uniref:type I protein arginine methyltransferase n=1 Tax=Talaromyces stipitatus (strain ATCC 10500 / CBS 375.48 / QM 6759 / NRRL 1006) TaxID=441959 RepID=B8M639_TALSN|nr:S-adenosylmethionine-dependent methyltransferase superfamily domain-containing protein [Talaromyces stipitatus ATCC 10500]EED19039.1 protein arginine methyltransferase RmtB [Talaromyces stipitatus ATCC 10500]